MFDDSFNSLLCQNRPTFFNNFVQIHVKGGVNSNQVVRVLIIILALYITFCCVREQWLSQTAFEKAESHGFLELKSYKLHHIESFRHDKLI